jgi:predicted acyltransferase
VCSGILASQASGIYLSTAVKNQRLIALDVFRGATIVLMIIVNNPGSWEHVWAPLRHASWFGCTLTDLVFPFFLFIVGVAMALAFSKFDHRMNVAAGWKIAKRTILLFLIGLGLNSIRPVDSITEFFTTLRIMGVLQRIALCYGITALLVLTIHRKALYGMAGGLLLFYWLLLRFTGGLEIETTLVRRLDVLILGTKHIYSGYGVPFDPEGILSTLPACVTVLLGYLTGFSIISERDRGILLRKMIGIGVLVTISGASWGLVFPIGKPLWTSSYVLYTGGLAMIVLGITIFLVDVRGYTKWAKPFVVFGANPLFIYTLSGIIARMMIYLFQWKDSLDSVTTLKAWLYTRFFVPLALGNRVIGSLLYALALILLYWIVANILYRKKIYIKI